MGQNKELLKQLEHMWLHGKQADIFIALYRRWAKPASSIAKIIGSERTNTYKIIQTMIRNGIVSEVNKKWIKYFFISDKDVLRHKLNQDKESVINKEKILPFIESELTKRNQERVSALPTVNFFEGTDGVKQLFDDMYTQIIDEQYLEIKFFASNTLALQSTSTHNLHQYAQHFFDELQRKKISIQWYLGNWIMMLDSILKSDNIQEIKELPAGNSSINIFVTGETIYLIIFKHIPFGLKIENEEFADVIQLLLKLSCK